LHYNADVNIFSDWSKTNLFMGHYHNFLLDQFVYFCGEFFY
jgi:hypothetical protein